MTKLYNKKSTKIVVQNDEYNFLTKMDVYKNQNSVVDHQYLLAQNVTMFGNGSTGSNVAVSLAKMGFSKFELIDRDYLNYHNAISSAYSIAQLDEFYGHLFNFRDQNNFSKLPFKVNYLRKLINDHNPMAEVKTYLTHLDRIPQSYANRGYDFRNGIINDRCKFLYRNVDLMNENMRGIVSTYKKANRDDIITDIMTIAEFDIDNIKQWFVDDNNTSHNRRSMDSLLTFVQKKLITGTFGVRFDRCFTAERDSTNMLLDAYIDSPMDMIDSYSLNHHYDSRVKNIIILCTDNLESRFDYIHNLILMNEKRDLIDKNTLIIDTRVGNTVEGEIIMFRPHNSDEVKHYYKSIISPKENKFEDIFYFSEIHQNWILKDDTTKVKFFVGGGGACGDSMSIIGAQMVSVIVSSALAQIFGKSLDIDESVYQKSYAFKLGKPTENFYGHSEYIV